MTTIVIYARHRRSQGCSIRAGTPGRGVVLMPCDSRDRFAAAAARPTRQTLGNAPIRTVQLVATAGLLESARIMLDLLSFAVLPGLLLAAGALLSHFGGAIFAALVPLAPYLATGLAAAVAWRFRQTKLVLTCAAMLLGYSL